MTYILDIESEGMPRYVGPFSYPFQADAWAKERVRNGSWSIIKVSPKDGL